MIYEIIFLREEIMHNFKEGVLFEKMDDQSEIEG
jgi:hypothetical protein